MGSRLESFPHYRLSGRSEFRLRVGDYRIFYEFALRRNQLYLVTSETDARSTAST